jgi:uncharacterized protein (DUF1778 family)
MANKKSDDEKKIARIPLRVTLAEKEHILRAAEITYMTASGFVRQSALDRALLTTGENREKS